MLAAPVRKAVPDSESALGPAAGQALLFATGPMECEFTSPSFDREETTLFLSLQPPGKENGVFRSGREEFQVHSLRSRDGQPFEQLRRVPLGSIWPSTIPGRPPRPGVVTIQRLEHQPLLSQGAAAASAPSGRHHPLALQVGQNLGYRLLQALAAGVDAQFGGFGLLVGAGDAGEVLDLAGAGLGIEALGVALFAHRQISGAMDLDEIASLDQGAGPAAVGAERGDEGGEHYHAGIEEQLGHLADAADVLLPVGVGEAQVGAEAVAHVVAIEHVAGQPLLEQGRIHRIGKGALAGAAQAREPEDGAAVAPLVRPGRPGHGGVVPHDVGGDPRLRGASRAGHRAVVSVGGGGGHGGRSGGGGGG